MRGRGERGGRRKKLKSWERGREMIDEKRRLKGEEERTEEDREEDKTREEIKG